MISIINIIIILAAFFFFVLRATLSREKSDDQSSESNLRKGPWTSEEDEILAAYVREHGPGNWNIVQKNTGLLRCGKSCRLRWTNHLRPGLRRGAFSKEEEHKVTELHFSMGNKWAKMALQLPGRTDNEIKNFWNTRLKKRARLGLGPYPDDIKPAFNAHNPQTGLAAYTHSVNGLEACTSSCVPQDMMQLLPEDIMQLSEIPQDTQQSDVAQNMMQMLPEDMMQLTEISQDMMQVIAQNMIQVSEVPQDMPQMSLLPEDMMQPEVENMIRVSEAPQDMQQMQLRAENMIQVSEVSQDMQQMQLLHENMMQLRAKNMIQVSEIPQDMQQMQLLPKDTMQPGAENIIQVSEVSQDMQQMQLLHENMMQLRVENMIQVYEIPQDMQQRAENMIQVSEVSQDMPQMQLLRENMMQDMQQMQLLRDMQLRAGNMIQVSEVPQDIQLSKVSQNMQDIQLSKVSQNMQASQAMNLDKIMQDNQCGNYECLGGPSSVSELPPLPSSLQELPFGEPMIAREDPQTKTNQNYRPHSPHNNGYLESIFYPPWQQLDNCFMAGELNTGINRENSDQEKLQHENVFSEFRELQNHDNDPKKDNLFGTHPSLPRQK